MDDTNQYPTLSSGMEGNVADIQYPILSSGMENGDGDAADILSEILSGENAEEENGSGQDAVIGVQQIQASGLPVNPPNDVPLLEDVFDFTEADVDAFLLDLHNHDKELREEVEEKTKEIEKLCLEKQAQAEDVEKLRNEKQAQATELENLRRREVAQAEEVDNLREKVQEQTAMIEELRKEKQFQASVIDEKLRTVEMKNRDNLDLRRQTQVLQTVLKTINQRLTQLIADEKDDNRPAAGEPASDSQGGLLPDLRNLEECLKFFSSKLDVVEGFNKEKSAVLLKLFGTLQDFKETRRTSLPDPTVSNATIASTSSENLTTDVPQSPALVVNSPIKSSIAAALQPVNPKKRKMSSGNQKSQEAVVGRAKPKSSAPEPRAHNAKEILQIVKVGPRTRQQVQGQGVHKPACKSDNPPPAQVRHRRILNKSIRLGYFCSCSNKTFRTEEEFKRHFEAE